MEPADKLFQSLQALEQLEAEIKSQIILGSAICTDIERLLDQARLDGEPRQIQFLDFALNESGNTILTLEAARHRVEQNIEAYRRFIAPLGL